MDNKNFKLQDIDLPGLGWGEPDNGKQQEYFDPFEGVKVGRNNEYLQALQREIVRIKAQKIAEEKARQKALLSEQKKRLKEQQQKEKKEREEKEQRLAKEQKAIDDLPNAKSIASIPADFWQYIAAEKDIDRSESPSIQRDKYKEHIEKLTDELSKTFPNIKRFDLRNKLTDILEIPKEVKRTWGEFAKDLAYSTAHGAISAKNGAMAFLGNAEYYREKQKKEDEWFEEAISDKARDSKAYSEYAHEKIRQEGGGVFSTAWSDVKNFNVTSMATATQVGGTVGLMALGSMAAVAAAPVSLPTVAVATAGAAVGGALSAIPMAGERAMETVGEFEEGRAYTSNPVYRNLIKSGVPEEEAKERAKSAAIANTKAVAMGVNTVLNMLPGGAVARSAMGLATKSVSGSIVKSITKDTILKNPQMRNAISRVALGLELGGLQLGGAAVDQIAYNLAKAVRDDDTEWLDNVREAVDNSASMAGVFAIGGALLGGGGRGIVKKGKDSGAKEHTSTQAAEQVTETSQVDQSGQQLLFPEEGQAVREQPIELSREQTTEPVREQSSEQIAEQQVVEPVREQSTEQITEQQSTEQIVEPVREQSTEQQSAEQIAEPVREQTAEQVSEQQIAEPVREQSTEPTKKKTSKSKVAEQSDGQMSLFDTQGEVIQYPVGETKVNENGQTVVFLNGEKKVNSDTRKDNSFAVTKDITEKDRQVKIVHGDEVIDASQRGVKEATSAPLFQTMFGYLPRLRLFPRMSADNTTVHNVKGQDIVVKNLDGFSANESVAYHLAEKIADMQEVNPELGTKAQELGKAVLPEGVSEGATTQDIIRSILKLENLHKIKANKESFRKVSNFLHEVIRTNDRKRGRTIRQKDIQKAINDYYNEMANGALDYVSTNSPEVLDRIAYNDSFNKALENEQLTLLANVADAQEQVNNPITVVEEKPDGVKLTKHTSEGINEISGVKQTVSSFASGDSFIYSVLRPMVKHIPALDNLTKNFINALKTVAAKQNRLRSLLQPHTAKYTKLRDEILAELEVKLTEPIPEGATKKQIQEIKASAREKAEAVLGDYLKGTYFAEGQALLLNDKLKKLQDTNSQIETTNNKLETEVRELTSIYEAYLGTDLNSLKGTENDILSVKKLTQKQVDIIKNNKGLDAFIENSSEVNALKKELSALSETHSTDSADFHTSLRSAVSTDSHNGTPTMYGMNKGTANSAVNTAIELVGSEKLSQLSEAARKINGRLLFQAVMDNNISPERAAEIVAKKSFNEATGEVIVLNPEETKVLAERLRELKKNREEHLDNLDPDALAFFETYDKISGELSQSLESDYVPAYRLDQVRTESDIVIGRQAHYNAREGSRETTLNGLKAFERNIHRSISNQGVPETYSKLATLLKEAKKEGVDLGITVRHISLADSLKGEHVLEVVDGEQRMAVAFTGKKGESLNREMFNLLGKYNSKVERGAFRKKMASAKNSLGSLMTYLNPNFLANAPFKYTQEAFWYMKAGVHRAAVDIDLSKLSVPDFTKHFADPYLWKSIHQFVAGKEITNAEYRALINQGVELGLDFNHFDMSHIKGLEKDSVAAKFKRLSADSMRKVDLAVNLMIYKSLIKHGVSPKDAVHIADAVNNYSRKTVKLRESVFDDLYPFLNSTLKGSKFAVESFVTPDGKFNKAVLKPVAVWAGAGFINSALQDLIFDEADLDGFKIPLGASLFFKQGMAYGLPRFGYALGASIYKLMKGDSPGKVSVDFISKGVLANFTPMNMPTASSNTESFTKGVIINNSPVVIKPLLELMMNESSFGTPIARNSNDRLPDSLAQPLSSALFTDIAATAFALSGGRIDINPNYIRHAVKGYLPGVLATTIGAVEDLYDPSVTSPGSLLTIVSGGLVKNHNEYKKVRGRTYAKLTEVLDKARNAEYKYSLTKDKTSLTEEELHVMELAKYLRDIKTKTKPDLKDYVFPQDTHKYISDKRESENLYLNTVRAVFEKEEILK